MSLICHRLLETQFCPKAVSYLCTALCCWKNVCLCSSIFLLEENSPSSHTNVIIPVFNKKEICLSKCISCIQNRSLLSHPSNSVEFHVLELNCETVSVQPSSSSSPGRTFGSPLLVLLEAEMLNTVSLSSAEQSVLPVAGT